MSIEVHVRVRPTSSACVWTAADTMLCSTVRQEQRFQFSRVYGATTANRTIFQGVDPIIHAGFDGKNVTVMAYGQTGSGKTHSMMGTPTDPGIVRRAAQVLVQLHQSHPGSKLQASCVEIYNERVRDLMLTERGQDIPLRDVDEGVTYERTMVEISTIDDFLAMAARAEGNRSYGVTNLNEHSSRSHVILSFLVSRSCRHVPSTINLVDLAGSEPAARANTEGATLREGGFINQSLLSLGNVVDAIVAGRSHVPYRASKLTRILRSCLGGSGFTFIVCCVNPSRDNYDQTIATLLFVQRAMKIRRDPTVTVAMAPLVFHRFVRVAESQLALMAEKEAAAYQSGVAEAYDYILPAVQRITDTYTHQMSSSTEKLRQLQCLLFARDHASGMRHLSRLATQVQQHEERRQTAQSTLQAHLRRGRDVEGTLTELREKRRRAERQYTATLEEAKDSKAQWQFCVDEEAAADLREVDVFFAAEQHHRLEIESQRHLFLEQATERLCAATAPIVQPFLHSLRANGASAEAVLRCREHQRSLQQSVLSLQEAVDLLDAPETHEGHQHGVCPPSTFGSGEIEAQFEKLRDEERRLLERCASQSPPRRLLARTSTSPLPGKGTTRIRTAIDAIHEAKSRVSRTPTRTEYMVASPDEALQSRSPMSAQSPNITRATQSSLAKNSEVVGIAARRRMDGTARTGAYSKGASQSTRH